MPPKGEWGWRGSFWAPEVLRHLVVNPRRGRGGAGLGDGIMGLGSHGLRMTYRECELGPTVVVVPGFLGSGARRCPRAEDTRPTPPPAVEPWSLPRTTDAGMGHHAATAHAQP